MGSVGSVQPLTQVDPPPGGNPGQLLIKSSSVSYAASWQTPTTVTGPEFQLQSGWYCDQRFLNGPSYQYWTGFPYELATYYVPVYFPTSLTIGALGWYGRSYSAMNLTFGISNPGSNGYPGTLLTSSAVATYNNANNIYWGVTLNYSVSPGWKWLSGGGSTVQSTFNAGVSGLDAQYCRTPLPFNPSGPAATVSGSLECSSSVATPGSNPSVTPYVSGIVHAFIFTVG